MAGAKEILSQLRAIIVGNDARMRALLRSQLFFLGLTNTFDAAGTGEAIDTIRAKRPNIVISNLAMTPTDGIALTRHLRQDEGSPNPYIPIILMARPSDRTRLAEALEAGVTDILAIPFTLGALRTHLVELVEHPRPYIRTGKYFGPDRRRPHANESAPQNRLTGTSTR